VEHNAGSNRQLKRKRQAEKTGARLRKNRSYRGEERREHPKGSESKYQLREEGDQKKNTAEAKKIRKDAD